MYFFHPTQPLSSQEPELLPDESVIARQDSVGLYEGKHKLDNQQDGMCFLTSHRIIYVDTSHPSKNSVDIELKRILEVQTWGRFLRSSPKVIMRLENDTSSAPTVAVQNKDDISCPACTFKNHPDMTRCEMCDSNLAAAIPSPTTSLQAMRLSDNEQDAHVRIAFRNGGHLTFVTKLKSAMSVKAWEKLIEPTPASKQKSKTVGIRAIQDQVAQSTRKVDEALSDSFRDLDRLMAKATEMVKLAESISSKMNKDPAQTDSDMTKLRGYLLNLGIASPVTRDAVGSVYYQELASELAAFLKKFLDTEAMKPLTEIYCIFNRARGVALISPEDLYKASQQFELLDLPFRLRRFDSGLLVIHSISMNDDRAAQRVLAHVKAQGGNLTALRLVQLEDLAFAVAEEQLKITERKGLICRDDGPSGLAFYENLFLQS